MAAFTGYTRHWELATNVIDTKRIIVYSLLLQRRIYGDQDPGYMSVKRLQATINDLCFQVYSSNLSYRILVDSSQDAIERTVIYNGSLLGLDEDAGLVYFRREALDRIRQEDKALCLSDEVKSMIEHFLEKTKDVVY